MMTLNLINFSVKWYYSEIIGSRRVTASVFQSWALERDAAD